MNIFSRFLSQFSRDASFNDFVAQWDEVEELILRVYKAGKSSPQDERLWHNIRQAALEQHRPFETHLAPLWKKIRAGGSLCRQDPFLALLSPLTPEIFVENWKALQLLPAARETINQALAGS